MKMQEYAMIATATSVLIACPALHATIYPNPLASHTELFLSDFPTTASTFEIRLGNGFGFGGINAPIFDSLTFSASDAGKVFPITQAQDPDFNSLRALLTNGQSDYMDLELSFDNFSTAAGVSSLENQFFAPLPAGNNGIDFQGFPIDNIALRLDSVNIGVSSYSITATIFVDSAAAVPEPSVGALTGLGGFLWLLARSKSR
jgi:hypothetical protein